MPAADVLAELLVGEASTSPQASCVTVPGGPGLRFNLAEVSTATRSLAAGEFIAYAIRLDLPLPIRLITITALSYRLRQVERILARGRVSIVGSFGIEPHLDAPSLAYELNSAAADYADRCLRPRGSAQQLRRLVAYFCGYDLALGGIVVVGRKN